MGIHSRTKPRVNSSSGLYEVTTKMNQPPTDQPPPSWRRPEGVAAGTWQYVNQRSIADHYDEFVAETPLCALDDRIIRQSLPGPPKDPETIFDFGCGTGRTAIPLADRGYDVVGVDLSRPMLQRLIAKSIAKSKAKSGDQSGAVFGVKANLVRLDCFADNVADHAVCMFSTLGMIQGRENRCQFLRHVCRLVRPGGQFILHVHNRWSALREPFGKTRLLKSWVRSVLISDHEFGDSVYAYRGLDKMFMHRYSRRELLSDLQASGWQLEQLHLVQLNGGDTTESIRQAGGFVAIARNN